jgi:hypothetical protein
MAVVGKQHIRAKTHEQWILRERVWSDHHRFANTASLLFRQQRAWPAEPTVYGILASYDDESFTSFWQELELDPNTDRTIPISQSLQPLNGPQKAPEVMVRMLRSQLAQIHYGSDIQYGVIPEPLETVFMDWSQKPFGAGYHAWAAHYDICDVMAKIRKPSTLVDGLDAEVYIVGSAYSNDQAWIEGAFCTAESVLNDFFGIAPMINPRNYPFICR